MIRRLRPLPVGAAISLAVVAAGAAWGMEWVQR
jgi:hypothetical protein